MTFDPAELVLKDAKDGTVLRLLCRAGRPKTQVLGIHDGALRVDIGAPPEKDKANRELLSWFSTVTGIEKPALELTAGHSNPAKSLKIRGLSSDDLRSRLFALARLTPKA